MGSVLYREKIFWEICENSVRCYIIDAPPPIEPTSPNPAPPRAFILSPGRVRVLMFPRAPVSLLPGYSILSNNIICVLCYWMVNSIFLFNNLGFTLMRFVSIN